MTTRPLVTRIALAAAAAAALGAGTVRAGGETWRTPDPPVLATGPTELTITGADLARAAKDVKRAQRKHGAPIPAVDVQVVDASGAGVRGVWVNVGVRVGKSGKSVARLQGATGADGRFALRPGTTDNVQKLAIDLTWDDGAKVVGVDLEPRADGDWRVTAAPYKDPVDREDEGSCRNLFRLERLGTTPAGGRRYVLTLRQPASLFACEEIVYGTDRKTGDLARLDSIGQRDVNRGDKNFFSARDEAQMGLEASRELDGQLELVTDPAITGYVKAVMERVVAASDTPGLPVNLRVVHTEDVNAFATAGGNVYVFTGLVAAAGNESQLAGVLAHELSHVVGRHVTEGATRQVKSQVGTLLGALATGAALDLSNKETEALVKGSLLTAGVVGMKYDRRAETEADLLGAQYLWKAGWDPEAIARFFELLDRQEKGSPPGWLSSHPTHEKRIASGVLWARAFLPSRDRYLVDTRAFADCQARVAALPPPRKKPSMEGNALVESLAHTGAFQAVVSRNMGLWIAEGAR